MTSLHQHKFSEVLSEVVSVYQLPYKPYGYDNNQISYSNNLLSSILKEAHLQCHHRSLKGGDTWTEWPLDMSLQPVFMVSKNTKPMINYNSWHILQKIVKAFEASKYLVKSIHLYSWFMFTMLGHTHSRVANHSLYTSLKSIDDALDWTETITLIMWCNIKWTIKTLDKLLIVNE